MERSDYPVNDAGRNGAVPARDDDRPDRPPLFAARWMQRVRESNGTTGAPGIAPPRPRRPLPTADEPQPVRESAPAGPTLPPSQLAALEEIKVRVHRRLIQELEPTRLDGMGPEEARNAIYQACRHLLTQEAPEIVGLARDEVIAAIADEVLGLGPIEALVRDPSISEIMVNGPQEIFYERMGKIYRSPARFRDNAHIMRIAERIVSRVGRRVDESSPMVDARLPDGSRVNIVIPPVAPKSPVITIRKFRQDKLTLDDLVKLGTLTPQAATFLRACVRIKRNIIVSGGTGSGKTTLLNALSGAIPDDERLVTIEDPTELKLQQPHVVTLEARPPSIEGKNEVTQRDLVRNALRMRPDRIIIGEVRGAETFDMLQAMNTGHEGSISTVHANSPRDCLARIESLVMMTGMELPLRVIREQIASAIHLVVHQSRLSDGSRKVMAITEITGMEGQTITMQDIFAFQHEGIDQNGKVHGELRPTGIRPTFAEMFELAGIDLPPELFNSGLNRWA